MVTPLLIVSSSGWAWTSRSRRSLSTQPSCPLEFSRRQASGLENLDRRRVVAPVRVPDPAVLEFRLGVDAQLALGAGQLVGELLAAGAELAPRGRVGRARYVAGDDDPLPLPLATGVGQWDRREQRLGVRVG